MRTKQEHLLNLKINGSMLRTFEVDIDSVEQAGSAFPSVISQALSLYAPLNPDVCASVYTFFCNSVNFGQPTYSAFVGVIGASDLASVLERAFRNTQGVRVRAGESIRRVDAKIEYHLEDGELWMPDEPGSWFAEGAELAEEVLEGIEEEQTEEPVERTATPLRYRAARSDAKLGSILSKIESDYGLPEGSVAILNPDGKKLRRDATIATVRKRWGE